MQGIPSPPSSPPLAALTSANELALIKKTSTHKKRDADGSIRKRRRGGATYHIRGECERLFCETMHTVFSGEEGSTGAGSIVMGANGYSPPEEELRRQQQQNYFANANTNSKTSRATRHKVDAWLEIWDYTGGCSFRAFVGGNGDKKSLFAFFDSAVVATDLKQGLMALIELAETVFAVKQVVICVDRAVPEADRKAFMKNLRWIGFEMTNLDMWADSLDVTSEKWLMLGMEI